jgi:glycosyltransferase involved in cell wall biosynthesis
VTNPLVSVVTPTWKRNDFVIRAIGSVIAQEYRPIQHLIVSDGPNPGLAERLAGITAAGYDLVVAQLPEHDPAIRWGHRARLHGIDISDGELIAYLDDDDVYRCDHLSRLVKLLLDNPEAGFSYSQILGFDCDAGIVSGASPPAYAQVSTSSLVHRREILDKASWVYVPGQLTIDWDIVERWMASGVKWAFYPAITAEFHRDAPNAVRTPEVWSSLDG